MARLEYRRLNPLPTTPAAAPPQAAPAPLVAPAASVGANDRFPQLWLHDAAARGGEEDVAELDRLWRTSPPHVWAAALTAQNRDGETP